MPDLNNKRDMEVSLNAASEYVDKNDASQITEKFKTDTQNGTNNLQNGFLQYAASEISKGKGNVYLLWAPFLLVFT